MPRVVFTSYLFGAVGGLSAGVLPALAASLGSISAVWEVEAPVTGYICSSSGPF